MSEKAASTSSIFHYNDYPKCLKLHFMRFFLKSILCFDPAERVRSHPEPLIILKFFMFMGMGALPS